MTSNIVWSQSFFIIFSFACLSYPDVHACLGSWKRKNSHYTTRHLPKIWRNPQSMQILLNVVFCILFSYWLILHVLSFVRIWFSSLMYRSRDGIEYFAWEIERVRFLLACETVSSLKILTVSCSSIHPLV